jgi:hypothetical protein
MKIIKILLLILLSLSIISCNSTKEEDSTVKTDINDPKIPGTNLDLVGDVRGVFNVRICPNAITGSAGCPSSSLDDTNQFTLTWSIPNLYRSENWIAVIFKARKPSDPYSCDNLGPGTLCTITNPKSPSFATYEVKRIKDTQWIDTDVSQNENYYYWIYLVLEGEETLRNTIGFWSTSSRYEAQATQSGTGAFLPSGAEFWKTMVRSTMVAAPSQGFNQLNTFNAGQPTVGVAKGRVAISSNGIIAVSDTNNNRILIFDNQLLRGCLDVAEDELSRFACLLSSSVQSITPVNILGQPDQTTIKSCQEHQNTCTTYLTQQNCRLTRDNVPSFCKWDTSTNKCEVRASDCLTKPTELLVDGNKLFIADSGNNRVLLYNNLLYSTPSIPDEKQIIGCDPDIVPGITRPIYCTPDKVFGKSSINDLTTYDFQFTGSSSLNNPTGLAVDGADLYIADTGNNRVVKAANFADNALYICTSESWLSDLCRWKAVLGQPDYFSNKTFKDFFNTSSSILGGTFSNIVQEGISPPSMPNGKNLFEGDSKNILKRYFRNPNKLKIVTMNNIKYLLISSHEDFEATSELGTTVALRGRILKFPLSVLQNANPQCNEATFATNKCEAVDVFGQEKFERVAILSGVGGGAGQYGNLAFGIDYIDDFEVLGNAMIAVDGTNNFVYQWTNISTKELDGYPFTSKILDPEGAYLGGNQSSPNLTGISGIAYDAAAGKCFVIDGAGSKIYILDFLNLGI